jgi:hypothetical protein
MSHRHPDHTIAGWTAQRAYVGWLTTLLVSTRLHERFRLYYPVEIATMEVSFAVLLVQQYIMQAA